MPVPTSGNPVTMRGIFSEKNEQDYDAQNIDGESNLSLRGLSSNSHADTSTGGNINLVTDSGANPPDQAAPHSISEFYGYNHSFVPTDWADSDGIVAAAATYFDASPARGSALQIKYRQNIILNFKGVPQGGADASTIQFSETTIPATVDQMTGITSQSTEVAGLGITNTGTNDRYENITKIEARWRFVNVDVSFNTDTDRGSTETIVGHVAPGGSLSTGTHTFRTRSQGAINNLNSTGSYVDITPTVGALSGGGAVTQTHFLELTADTSGAGNTDFVKIETNDSNPSTEFVALDIRLNEDDNKVLTIRSSGVEMQATSFRQPEISCIMPDMRVVHQTKGTIRIGDVVVGDHIMTRGDLTDPTVEPIFTEVTEARTHTRSGYWVVNGELHITNDHPVYLKDQWVKVEDMRDDINRTYVEGTVDPVYLGTTSGHYYVLPAKDGYDYEYLVDGNYAPTTE